MSIIGAAMVPHPPLIVPEVGRGQEQAISKTITAYRNAALLLIKEKPETIVVLSPHSIMYADYFHISPGAKAKSRVAQFGAGEVKFEVKYDTEFVEALSRRAEISGLPAGTYGEKEKKLDHGTMVPLYFIQQTYGGEIDAALIRIGMSGLPYSEHYKLGILIGETAERLNRKTVIVASGDLSHRLKSDGPYGYKAEGPVYDEKIMNVMGSGNFGELFDMDEAFCEIAGECGHRTFITLAGCFNGKRVKAEKLSYEGPFGVGYGLCTFIPIGYDEERFFLDKYNEKHNEQLNLIKQHEDEYVRLARRAVEAYVLRDEKIKIPGNLSAELTENKAGVFVSLKKHGQLRGCIGTITATTENVAAEIINNAISAASRDTRFPPVGHDELNEIVYSVDILGEAEDIESGKELDVARYGVIVTSGSRRGLLLPNLDGVDTAEQQIDIARQKAGIRPNEKIKLQRFEVVRHY
ncbi:MAG: AmmeMemoRadiSam system protein A [Eubacteriales bacterium]|nr:AmmeMemoRadiSam system protein A [Eubacteriales bacterium]